MDAVLDTDAYNEIDDQFAIAYMLANAIFYLTIALGWIYIIWVREISPKSIFKRRKL